MKDRIVQIEDVDTNFWAKLLFVRMRRESPGNIHILFGYGFRWWDEPDPIKRQEIKDIVPYKQEFVAYCSRWMSVGDIWTHEVLGNRKYELCSDCMRRLPERAIELHEIIEHKTRPVLGGVVMFNNTIEFNRSDYILDILKGIQKEMGYIL